jgi:hypothetical protein
MSNPGFGPGSFFARFEGLELLIGNAPPCGTAAFHAAFASP